MHKPSDEFTLTLGFKSTGKDTTRSITSLQLSSSYIDFPFRLVSLSPKSTEQIRLSLFHGAPPLYRYYPREILVLAGFPRLCSWRRLDLLLLLHRHLCSRNPRLRYPTTPWPLDILVDTLTKRCRNCIYIRDSLLNKEYSTCTLLARHLHNRCSA